VLRMDRHRSTRDGHGHGASDRRTHGARASGRHGDSPGHHVVPVTGTASVGTLSRIQVLA
jgi:hypothetical protein